jgi:CRP/FNR family transcriptional regulator, cyclic AMP receptor protein
VAADQPFNLTLSTGQIRRLKVLADFTDDQLDLFVSLVEPVQVKPNRVVVRRGDPGDCMYLLLDGEVRVSNTVEGRETILAKLETGDFFGEICLFDEGARSADVLANRDCTLLKITKHAFEEMIVQHPVLGALFLRAMFRVVVFRLRNMDKRYVDSILLSRFWNKGSAT